MTVRARAAMAAGTVHDEARQDEGHAGDTDQVRKALGADAGVGSMACVLEVDHHVHHATEAHDQQADEHERRKPPKRQHGLYQQHLL